MATYLLNDETFTSKDAIKRRVQGIFAAYSAGESLRESDEKFVLALLEWHPQAGQKIGVGVDHIEIHIPKPWTAKGFLLVRKDGSKIDFSYKVCLNPKLAEQTMKFNSAARSAIVDQIVKCKMAAFSQSEVIQCAASGRDITWAEAHVDHYPVAFADLLEQYIASSGIDVKAAVFNTEGCECKFADIQLSKDFADWHAEHATLRVIAGDVNVKLGRHKAA